MFLFSIFCMITVCIIFLINILFSNLYFLLGDCFLYFSNIFLTPIEVGVNLKNGYNGDISAKDAGRIGGNMVKKMIQKAESQMLK